MVSAPCRSPATVTGRLQFDSAFLDRRMAEHKELMEHIARGWAADIIDEVADGIFVKIMERGENHARENHASAE